jgi:DNA polymerase sigma
MDKARENNTLEPERKRQKSSKRAGNRIESFDHELSPTKIQKKNLIKPNPFQYKYHKTPFWLPEQTNLKSHDQLHLECIKFIKLLKPTNTEIEIRNKVFNNVKKWIESYDINLEARLFGSGSHGLFIPHSDLDIVICSRNIKSSESLKKSDMLLYLLKLAKLGKNSKSNLKLSKKFKIINAKVPLLKLLCKKTRIPIDISMNSYDASLKALTVATRMRKQLPGFDELFLLLKQFLNIRGLDSNATNGVGGYGLLLWVGAFLRIHDSIYPDPDEKDGTTRKRKIDGSIYPDPDEKDGTTRKRKIDGSIYPDPDKKDGTTRKRKIDGSVNILAPLDLTRDLVVEDDVLKKADIGLLFLHFLHFFGFCFDYLKVGLCPGGSDDLNTVLISRREHIRKYNIDKLMLYIVDPLDEQNIVTAQSTNIGSIVISFRHAYSVLLENLESETDDRPRGFLAEIMRMEPLDQRALMDVEDLIYERNSTKIEFNKNDIKAAKSEFYNAPKKPNANPNGNVGNRVNSDNNGNQPNGFSNRPKTPNATPNGNVRNHANSDNSENQPNGFSNRPKTPNATPNGNVGNRVNSDNNGNQPNGFSNRPKTPNATPNGNVINRDNSYKSNQPNVFSNRPKTPNATPNGNVGNRANSVAISSTVNSGNPSNGSLSRREIKKAKFKAKFENFLDNRPKTPNATPNVGNHDNSVAIASTDNSGNPSNGSLSRREIKKAKFKAKFENFLDNRPKTPNATPNVGNHDNSVAIASTDNSGNPSNGSLSRREIKKAKFKAKFENFLEAVQTRSLRRQAEVDSGRPQTRSMTSGSPSISGFWGVKKKRKQERNAEGSVNLAHAREGNNGDAGIDAFE